MPYLLVIEKRAQKEFLKIPRAFALPIKEAISVLEHNPRPHGTKKLAGSADGYRIRIGVFRVLYTIDDRRRVLTVYRIRHRKDAY